MHFLITFLFIIFWAIGFFALEAGALVHLLLVFAIITLLFRVLRNHG